MLSCRRTVWTLSSSFISLCPLSPSDRWRTEQNKPNETSTWQNTLADWQLLVFMLQREVAIFYLLRDLYEEFKKGEIRLYVIVNIRNALLQITHCCLPPGSLSYFIDWPRRFLEWRHCSNEKFSWREGREDRYHFCGLGELDMLQTAEQRLRRLKHRTINYHPRNMVTNMKVFSSFSNTS